MRDYEELVKRLREEVREADTFKLMADLFEAADAIEELQKRVDVEKAFSDAWEENANECRVRFQKLLATFPKWISVNERLPEKEGYYITAFRFGDVGSNVFMRFNDGEGKWYQNSKDTGEVTHWMNLPEPPKEDKP